MDVKIDKIPLIAGIRGPLHDIISLILAHRPPFPPRFENFHIPPVSVATYFRRFITPTRSISTLLTPVYVLIYLMVLPGKIQHDILALFSHCWRQRLRFIFARCRGD